MTGPDQPRAGKEKPTQKGKKPGRRSGPQVPQPSTNSEPVPGAQSSGSGDPLSGTTLPAGDIFPPDRSTQPPVSNIVMPDPPTKSPGWGVGIGEGTQPWKVPTETEEAYRERMYRLGLPYKPPSER